MAAATDLEEGAGMRPPLSTRTCEVCGEPFKSRSDRARTCSHEHSVKYLRGYHRREEVRERVREYRQRPEVRERIRESQRRWRQRRKDAA